MVSQQGVKTLKRFVIFGGSGFIGQHLAQKLLSDDPENEIIILDLKKPTIVNPNIKFIFADVRALEDICIDQSISTVFNLAAIHTTPGHAPHEYYDTNINGALEINAFCERHDVREIVFLSTMSVYAIGRAPKTEETKPDPTSDYGRSKYIAEKIHSDWSKKEGRRLITCRPAVIFGPNENGNFSRMAKLFRSRFFIYPGDGSTIKSCYHVDGLIDDIILALNHTDKTILFNAAYTEDTSLSDIMLAFQEIYGKPYLKFSIPLWLLQLIMTFLKPLDFFGLGIHPDRAKKLVSDTNIKSVWVPEHSKVTRLFRTDLHKWKEVNDCR